MGQIEESAWLKHSGTTPKQSGSTLTKRTLCVVTISSSMMKSWNGWVEIPGLLSLFSSSYSFRTPNLVSSPWPCFPEFWLRSILSVFFPSSLGSTLGKLTQTFGTSLKHSGLQWNIRGPPWNIREAHSGSSHRHSGVVWNIRGPLWNIREAHAGSSQRHSGLRWNIREAQWGNSQRHSGLYWNIREAHCGVGAPLDTLGERRLCVIRIWKVDSSIMKSWNGWVEIAWARSEVKSQFSRMFFLLPSSLLYISFSILYVGRGASFRSGFLSTIYQSITVGATVTVATGVWSRPMMRPFSANNRHSAWAWVEQGGKKKTKPLFCKGLQSWRVHHFFFNLPGILPCLHIHLRNTIYASGIYHWCATGNSFTEGSPPKISSRRWMLERPNSMEISKALREVYGKIWIQWYNNISLRRISFWKPSYSGFMLNLKVCRNHLLSALPLEPGNWWQRLKSVSVLCWLKEADSVELVSLKSIIWFFKSTIRWRCRHFLKFSRSVSADFAHRAAGGDVGTCEFQSCRCGNVPQAALRNWLHVPSTRRGS